MTTTDRRHGVNASQAIKVPCDYATTANITLSAEQTIDGNTTSTSRVLVKNQTDATENGIYKSSSGTWTREPDFDGNYDIRGGTIIPVQSGTANANTYWRITNTGTITIGTTELTIAATTVISSAILSDGSVKMAADFDPASDATYDLGSATAQWRDLFLSRNLTVGGSIHMDDSIFIMDVGANVASASALNLGADGNFFNITGTTAITSIQSEGVGTMVVLRFAGALTLTHDATNLVLPGSADITTAAGDIAVFYEYQSADWRCISYQKAAYGPLTYTPNVWTPALADSTLGDGASESQTYGEQVGTYTQIGRQIFIQGRMTMTSLGTLTGGDQAAIVGLPAAAAASNAAGGISVTRAENIDVTATESITGYIPSGASYILLENFSSTGGSTNLTVTEVSSDGSIDFFGQYYV
jgi:uncharacterized cupin superfamily protein